MSESDLQRAIVSTLRLKGYRVLRLNAGLTVVQSEDGKRRAIRGVGAGTPDLLVMLTRGRVVWLEVKAPRGRLTPHQSKWHREAGEAGHYVAVVRSIHQALDAVKQGGEVL